MESFHNNGLCGSGVSYAGINHAGVIFKLCGYNPASGFKVGTCCMQQVSNGHLSSLFSNLSNPPAPQEGVSKAREI